MNTFFLTSQNEGRMVLAPLTKHSGLQRGAGHCSFCTPLVTWHSHVFCRFLVRLLNQPPFFMTAFPYFWIFWHGQAIRQQFVDVESVVLCGIRFREYRHLQFSHESLGHWRTMAKSIKHLGRNFRIRGKTAKSSNHQNQIKPEFNAFLSKLATVSSFSGCHQSLH